MSASDKKFKVLVTGFGPFLDIKANPSWGVAHQLPNAITGINGEIIEVIVPPDPTPAAYHRIFDQVPKLISEHQADLIVHMGLNVDSGPGIFKVERSAPKEGYHDIPDIDRKVFTRAENKKAFAKSSASLITTLDIDSAAETWQIACSSMRLPSTSTLKAKGKSKNDGRLSVEVRLSDVVGTYVCGFQYYASLLEMQRKTGKRDVVFLHVPRLESEEELKIGVKVVEELVKALVGVLR